MTTEERIEKLERSVRQQRRVMVGICSLAFLCLAVWLLVRVARQGQTPAAAGADRVVRARELILIDESGAVRARMGMEKGEGGGWPRLTFYNWRGDAIVELSTTATLPSLTLSGAGRRAAVLSAAGTEGGNPGLELYGDEGGEKTTLGLPYQGLKYYDANEQERAALEVGILGPTLVFSNPEGEPVMDLSMSRKAGAMGRKNSYYLILCDAEGNPIWGAP
jgi:hypothetical protein